MNIDFLLIGAAKAGTTYFHNLFEISPSTFVPKCKETFYFALKDSEFEFKGPGDEKLNRNAIRSEKEYLKVFQDSTPDQKRGEVCPLYLYSSKAIENIYTQAPNTKLIAFLREPVSRAIATYDYMVLQGREHLSFEDSIAAETERIALGYQHIWHYIKMGHYEEQLQIVQKFFPKNRLLVKKYDKHLFSSEGLKEISEFLELPRYSLSTDTLDIGRVNQSGVPVNFTGSLIFNNRAKIFRKLGKLLLGRKRAARLRSSLLKKSEPRKEFLDQISKDFGETRSYLKKEFSINL